MNQNPNSFRSILKHPSAFLPIAMSLAALGVLASAAIYGFLHGAGGIIRQPDEGTAAHLWQLLMAGQLPVLLYLRNQVAAPRSKTDPLRARTAGRSRARIHGPRLLSQSINDGQRCSFNRSETEKAACPIIGSPLSLYSTLLPYFFLPIR